jgi:RimJ/RimL family protein N-acetyltransferase
MLFIQNIILENHIALLRPMETEDISGLKEIAFDEELWNLTTSIVTNEEELKAYIAQALNDRKREFRYPFVIEDKKSGKIAGSSSYANISENDGRVEIGWTWLGKEFRGSGLNKACKFLMISYAFEKLGMYRVEFKTDVLNKRSRRALEKIGATEEGILRSHMLLPSGRRRDSIYYSILKTEWDRIKNSFFKEYLSP